MRTLGIETYLPDDSSGHIHMMHICPVADEQHTHDFFELVYVVHGSANHRMGEERSALHAGDFFVIDTGSSHSYEAPVDFEIVNCLFLPEYAGSALENCPSLSALLSNKMLRFGVPVDLKAADSSVKRCAASPIRWYSLTRWKRLIRMCSISCCRC